MIWKQLGERREHHGEALLSRDQLGRDVLIPSPVRRIVSLVPSITQTLYDLGCEDRVVGITGFCPRGTRPKRVVGGTKNLRMRNLMDLKPDLVIGAKEENTQEMVSEISKVCSVWMSGYSQLQRCLPFFGSSW